MNFHNKKLLTTSYLKLSTLKLLTRHANKIAVELDSNLRSKLESIEIKPRQQPGIIKLNPSNLPTNISTALQRVIGDHPVKKILADCKKLNRYIASRHPPPEKHEIVEKMRKINADVEKRMPTEESIELTEEQLKQWEYKREQLKQNLAKQRIYSWKPITYGKFESIVYAIGRGAQEYAILLRILQEITARDANFKPRSYFDFGSGVGTGMWAANTIWKDDIFEYFNVDSSSEMHELSEFILRGGIDNQSMSLRNVFYRQFLPSMETKYDLVVSAFSLFELPSSQNRKEVMLNLWSKCSGYMIIVEEGSRRGTELVVEARDYLLKQTQKHEHLKGHVFAPCPHNLTCPRLAKPEDHTPCNFQLSYTPLKINNRHLDHQHAIYSYCILKKGEIEDETISWPRLVRPTLVRSRHTICKMCTIDAKLQEIIFTKSKHGKIAYQCAKVSRWGDRLPIVVGETYETETRHSKKMKAMKDKWEQIKKAEFDEGNLTEKETETVTQTEITNEKQTEITNEKQTEITNETQNTTNTQKMQNITT